MRLGKRDLNLEERQEIYKLSERRYGVRKIGRILNRSASTVSRELKRLANYSVEMVNNLVWYDQARLSQDIADKKRAGKRKRYVSLINAKVEEFVLTKLKKKWSPEIISLRLKIEHPEEKVSHETIYQFIYKHQPDYVKYLNRKGKTRRYSGKGKSRPGRFTKTTINPLKRAKRNISTRPESANNRSEMGHLETDLIVSPPGKGKSSLQVTVDRSVRKLTLTKVASREANEARRKLYQKLRLQPPEARRTLTADNGAEHTDLPLLEAILPGLKVYYCNPYRSWERGTVESINGILRREFPKGTNFDEITDDEIQRVEDWFNNRPMVVLNGRTPNEAYQEQLACLNAIDTT